MWSLGRRMRGRMRSPVTRHLLRGNGLQLDPQGDVVQDIPIALEERDLCPRWRAAGRCAAHLLHLMVWQKLVRCNRPTPGEPLLQTKPKERLVLLQRRSARSGIVARPQPRPYRYCCSRRCRLSQPPSRQRILGAGANCSILAIVAGSELLHMTVGATRNSVVCPYLRSSCTRPWPMATCHRCADAIIDCTGRTFSTLHPCPIYYRPPALCALGPARVQS